MPLLRCPAVLVGVLVLVPVVVQVPGLVATLLPQGDAACLRGRYPGEPNDDALTFAHRLL